MSRGSDSASSIRRRLLLFLLPALFALALAGVFMNYRVALLIVSSAYDERLGDAARALAARVRVADGDPSARAARTKARPAGAGLRADSSPAGSAAAISSLLGANLQYSIRGARGQLLAGDPRLRPAPAGAASLAYADTQIEGRKLRVATYRLPTRLGIAAISVAEPEALRAGPAHFILASTWLMDFIQVDVTLLLAWIAVHFGLKPLLAVRRQIEMRSVRELQPLQAADVPAEVRPLVDTLNLLFDMLREAARSQRQFVADTAHQLRTPIAGLMGHLELLMHEPAAAPVRDRLALLQEGMSRFAHSTNQLLALARADPAVSAVERFESVRLEDLVGRVVELNVSRAAASGHDLGADVRPVEVSGNPRLLEDLLGNLVDNALAYTPAGGRVTVRCGVAGAAGAAGVAGAAGAAGAAREAPFLEVEDDGPGIPESERARVRQRFYRIPGTAGRGCGLGLAIVEEIARLHDAEVILDAGAEGVGTRVRVRFPATAAA